MQEGLTLSVIVPVYNEEAVIHETHRRLKDVLDSLNEPYEVIFVNDGSRDGTAALAGLICKDDPRYKLIDFSRNFGHQVAITAGMEYASGDAIVVIDADLQDPPELIPQMLKKWREGYDVVYGRRTERKGETFFKKFTARAFYRLLKKLTDMDIPVDTGDFRLIGRNVCDALKQINEKNRYVRGIISWLGFRQTGIEFVRDKRFAGETKYPLKKMLKFAFDAISSFSYKPLKLAAYIGFFISMVSFCYLIIVLYEGLFSAGTVPGWASTLAVSLFFNGIVLIILGIIGGYLGRIYDEAKDRPLYIVRQLTNFNAAGSRPSLNDQEAGVQTAADRTMTRDQAPAYKPVPAHTQIPVYRQVPAYKKSPVYDQVPVFNPIPAYNQVSANDQAPAGNQPSAASGPEILPQVAAAVNTAAAGLAAGSSIEASLNTEETPEQDGVLLNKLNPEHGLK